VPFYALLLSFIVGGVLIAIIGVNPFEAYWALLRGAFGSPERHAGSIARSVPFVGSALALAFAFRAGLFNIGAEGQLLVGGVTAAWVGTWAFMYDTPGILAIPIIILAGFIGGAFWGGIPGVLRAKTGLRLLPGGARERRRADAELEKRASRREAPPDGAGAALHERHQNARRPR
jgi:simple sugar transport system permease protein